MSTGECIILCAIALLFVLKLYLENYLSKKAQNKADKEDSREISYEAEKGKNLATKEDIAEITKVVEDLKSGVLFEHQRKHNFIEKREALFLSILHHAEEIQSSSFLVFIYLHSQHTEEKLHDLINHVNKEIQLITHEVRQVMVSYKDGETELFELLDQLKKSAFKYGREICCNAINAANLMSNIRNKYNLYMQNNQDQQFINEALKDKKQLDELGNNLHYDYEQEFISKTSDYVVMLCRLYKKDFHLNY